MGFITNDKEAYLFMKDHLLNQMEKSVDQVGDCTYRGYDDKTLCDLKDEAEAIALKNDILDDEYEYDIYRDLLASHAPNLKCAVGALIIDTFYSQNLEGRTVCNDENDIVEAVQKSNPVWKITERSIKLMKAFQNIHDSYEPSVWEYRIDKLKDNFNDYNDFSGVSQ